MALFAELIAGLTGDSKPKVPSFTPVNAQTIQQQTLTGNTSALPETIAQTNAINTAQFANIDKLLAQASGGVYDRLRKKSLFNIEDLLGGGDVTDTLRGTAAANLYRGVAGTGFGLSTSIKNSAAQAQANKAQGFDSLQRWIAGVSSTYQPVSVAGMFARNTYDLPTALGHATEERNAKFQRDFVKNQWDWYGSFGQQLVRFEDSVVQLAGDIAGAVV